MSEKKLLPRLLFPCLLLVSCRPADSRFERAYAEALAQNQGRELILALSGLDQTYPDRIKVKITLGGLLLAAGDLSGARIVLERGEELIPGCRDADLQGLLFTNLAELRYRQGQYSRGLDCADKALRAAPGQALGVEFTRAKCLYALGRYRESLDSFRQAPDKAPMTGEDLDIFAALLLNHGEAEAALQALRERERRHGYVLGLGLQESSACERLGRFEGAVFAAAKDMEYRRSLGLIDDARLLENLKQLSALLPSAAAGPLGSGQSAVRAYSAFIRRQWGQCTAALAELGGVTPFSDYLLLASLLEAGAADPEHLYAYRMLEGGFRLLPAYHYHLWRGLKACDPGYSVFTARAVLESCILLAPQSGYARESRNELGRLLGLSGPQSEKLLLGAELDALYARLEAGAEPAILQPALELLMLPNNIYRSAAVLVITRARRFPGVEEYIAGQPGFLALLGSR